MTDWEYIHNNKDADVRSLALKKVPEGVHLSFCLEQIEGYQLAKKKLPSWAKKYEETLHSNSFFPPHLSMEQCSSEATAIYKKGIVDRLDVSSLTDLTGGFGVDFSYMAQGLDDATYVERQEVLCERARHNMPLLGLPNAKIVCANCEEFLNNIPNHHPFQSPPLRGRSGGGLFFLDPARRDDCGRKVYSISDCTPDVSVLQDKLLAKADYVLIKLSPMLDITQALKTLKNVTEVHVVSLKGECKELLLLIEREAATLPVCYCVNLETDDEPLVCGLEKGAPEIAHDVSIGMMLYEPNASIMKAGVQDVFGERYGLKKLHPMSNLFVGATPSSLIPHPSSLIPARSFTIVGLYDFSKQSLKALQREVPKANITIRNFPSTVADLRKRLKIKEGGNDFLFVTTLANGNHIILHCRRLA